MILGESLLRIGQVAKISGLSLRTIDYYTRNGLLEYSRSASNYRLYGQEVLQTIERIKLLKKQRLSLEEIKASIQTVNLPSKEKMIRDVQADIDSLQKRLSQLEETMRDASPEEKKLISQQIGNQLAVLVQLGMLF
ncbi:MerR family transcriptional regulator [Bacillus sp. FSL K6-3431]|uniref:MerR family transcriptional regulator n=1 Tax=Bacillus sp. FSL K6-3431 TaxID=2921500 RepID=UPI0030F866A3